MAAISAGVRKQGRSLAGTVNCRCAAVGSGLPLTGHRFGFRAYAAVVQSVTRRARTEVRKITMFFIRPSSRAPGIYKQAGRSTLDKLSATMRGLEVWRWPSEPVAGDGVVVSPAELEALRTCFPPRAIPVSGAGGIEKEVRSCVPRPVAP